MRPRMDNNPNERPGCHAPRPPQPQFPGIPHSQVRSYDAQDRSNVGLLDALLDDQLYGIDEQSSVAGSYENEDYGSQSSPDYCAEQSPCIPCTDYTQGYRQWPSSAPQNYFVRQAQENDVLQAGEDSGSIGRSLQQQGNHMVATSALGLGDARHHSNSQAPEIEFNTVGHASRNSQHEPSGTDRRSSVGSRPLVQTSNLEMTRISLGSRRSAIQVSTSDWQFDPPEAVTTGYWDPYLFAFDRPSGNGRSLATTRAHINPNVSEPWHNDQTSYQGVPEYPLASYSQHQTQGSQRGRRGSLPFAQDRSVMPSFMPSLDNHGFARNPHGPPQGNTETHLSPTWQPAHKTSSSSQYDERSNVSDQEVWQSPRITTRRSKRKCPSEPPSLTTLPTGTKRRRRRFTPEERAQINHTRKTGACPDCRKAKRKVFGKSKMDLYRCRQAYRSYSARIRPLGSALP